MTENQIKAVRESIDNLYQCLDRIADETEVRPGETTIRGTDAGVIDATEILRAVDVARHDLADILEALGLSGEGGVA